MRQATLDPRIPRYAEPVTTSDLERALRILRGLFDLGGGSAHGGNIETGQVTLRGAIRWASLLLALADEAESEERLPPLPLPYFYLTRSELAERETTDALGQADAITPRTTRRRHQRTAKEAPRNTPSREDKG
jgi:hypothetical protein